uniref:Uncharacterized protein n=1 Tax=Ciona intestinalis TaxID=7719 RepID=F6Z0G2_CIOIN
FSNLFKPIYNRLLQLNVTDRFRPKGVRFKESQFYSGQLLIQTCLREQLQRYCFCHAVSSIVRHQFLHVQFKTERGKDEN